MHSVENFVDNKKLILQEFLLDGKDIYEYNWNDVLIRLIILNSI